MNSADDALMIRSLVVVLTTCLLAPIATRTIILVVATTPVDTRQDQRLLAAAALFTVAVLVHSADHLRRGTDAINTDVFVLGTAGAFLEVAVVVLACQRHRVAPLAAAAVGATLAAGYVGVHFLPARSLFSDSFTSATHVSPLSWLAASFEVAAAVTFAVVGTGIVRERGLAAAAEPYAGQRPLREGIGHPLALTMIVGMALTLVISFVQL
jgi:hypothetical protein